MLHSLSILLASPTNIRLGWKGLPRTNTSLLRKSVNYTCKKFIVQAPELPNPNKKYFLTKVVKKVFSLFSARLRKIPSYGDPLKRGSTMSNRYERI
jgi:hypothetical protein